MIISQSKGKAGFRCDPLPVDYLHYLIKKTHRFLRVKRTEVLLYFFI